jgi:hypothetical protein
LKTPGKKQDAWLLVKVLGTSGYSYVSFRINKSTFIENTLKRRFQAALFLTQKEGNST